jgi:hypothetical protein
LFTSYIGQTVYNFDADFVVPVEDRVLAKLIVKWNDGWPLSLKLISRITERVDDLGGANLLWS